MSNVLFLSAGYGTRLARDIDGNHSYSHLSGIAKTLLPLLKRPLLDHWISKFLKELDIPKNDLFQKIFIICNDLHHLQFVEWANTNNFPIDHLLNNKTTSNETRNGAVYDLKLAIEHFGLGREPLLVIAGDTLFLDDFSISGFLNAAANSSASLVTHYRVKSDEEMRKTGILVLDDSGKVVDFLEKPDPKDTSSRLACPCFYYIYPDAQALLKKFLDVKRDAELTEIDATGKWIQWVIHETDFYSFEISGRLDIGGLDTFIEAEKYLDNN